MTLDKVRIKLYFPDDVEPVDVSYLERAQSASLDTQFCSDDHLSAVDVFRFALKHDLGLVTKLQDAHERIGIEVTELESSDPIFLGVIEPTTAQSAGETVGSIELEAVDNSWRLDEPIAQSFSIPAIIGESGWYLYNSSSPATSIFHHLALMAGYSLAEITTAIFPEVIPYAAATANEQTYREYLDAVLSEDGYVVHSSSSGILYIAPWIHEGDAYDDTIGPDDLSTVTPVTWTKTAEYRDGSNVVWTEPTIITDALMYRDSLPVSADGVFEGQEIAAEDYYPKDSDIQDTYQDFVDTWLDVPYQSRATRLQNKDLSLITTSNHLISFSADAGIVIDYQAFEGLRARVRFRNTSGATAKIYSFEIRAKALIRLSLKNVSSPEAAANPREHMSQFIFNSAVAIRLARAQANAIAFSDFKYSFACNRALSLGIIIRLVEPRMGIDTRCLVQKCVESQGAPQAQISALAISDPSELSFREWVSGASSAWLAAYQRERVTAAKPITITLFIRSVSVPEQPETGEPEGWTTNIPSGSDPLWSITAKQRFDGIFIEGWSFPSRVGSGGAVIIGTLSPPNFVGIEGDVYRDSYLGIEWVYQYAQWISAENFADSAVTPREKARLQREWVVVKSEYETFNRFADALGIKGNSAYGDYVAVYQQLYNVLFTTAGSTPPVLSDLTTVSSREMLGADITSIKNAYELSRAELQAVAFVALTLSTSEVYDLEDDGEYDGGDPSSVVDDGDFEMASWDSDLAATVDDGPYDDGEPLTIEDDGEYDGGDPSMVADDGEYSISDIFTLPTSIVDDGVFTLLE